MNKVLQPDRRAVSTGDRITAGRRVGPSRSGRSSTDGGGQGVRRGSIVSAGARRSGSPLGPRRPDVRLGGTSRERAHGGCLGGGGRGRTRSRGEMPWGGADSLGSRGLRMGQPPRRTAGDPGVSPGGEPGELKHLSTPRSREDSLSSGERRGRSPNRGGGTACRRCRSGVGRADGRGRQPPRLRRRRSRSPLEGGTAAGESPVGDAATTRVHRDRE